MRMFAAALWVLLSVPAFGAGPTFQDFESACRFGNEIALECQEGAYLAFIEERGLSEANCDWANFWYYRDQTQIPADASESEGLSLIFDDNDICR